MELLITPEELSTYRNTSKKIDTSAFREAIKNAQSVDLFDVLSDELYFSVLLNPSHEKYKDLIDGSEFEMGDITYVHEGLKSVLADFAYARLVKNLNIQPTAFGLVTKSSENSDPVPLNRTNDLVQQIRLDASVKMSLVNNYIQSQLETNTVNKGSISTFSQSFSIIRPRR